MKNLFVYYLAILLPLGALIWLLGADLFDSWITLVLFFTYVLVYRTWTDGSRLVAKGIIKKGDRWRMLLPGMRMKHFRELYLR